MSLVTTENLFTLFKGAQKEISKPTRVFFKEKPLEKDNKTEGYCKTVSPWSYSTE